MSCLGTCLVNTSSSFSFPPILSHPISLHPTQHLSTSSCHSLQPSSQTPTHHSTQKEEKAKTKMPLAHISLPVSSLPESTAFYTSLLKPLGYEVSLSFDGAVGFAPRFGAPDFCAFFLCFFCLFSLLFLPLSFAFRVLTFPRYLLLSSCLFIGVCWVLDLRWRGLCYKEGFWVEDRGNS